MIRKSSSVRVNQHSSSEIVEALLMEHLMQLSFFQDSVTSEHTWHPFVLDFADDIAVLNFPSFFSKAAL